MTRLAMVVLMMAGMAFSMIGCTHTVRGLGRDLGSEHMQNYNSRGDTASDLDY